MLDTLEGNLHGFLSAYPQMRLLELNGSVAVIEGNFHVLAHMPGAQEIDESLSLRLIVKRDFPRSIPTVMETSRKIPRDSKYHTYSDGTFCLGSDLRLKLILNDCADLESFFEFIVIPFLYSVFHKIRFGVFPYGELKHGSQGLVEDYEELFGVKGYRSVVLVFKILSLRKREANKLPCPCCCGQRLGRCLFRFRVSKWRYAGTRKWYKKYLAEHMIGGYESEGCA